MATITTTTTRSLLFQPSATNLRRNNHHSLNPNHHPTSLFLPPLKLTLKNPPKPNYYLKPSIFSSLNLNLTQTPQILPNSTKTLTTLFTLTSKIAQFILITPFFKLKTLISSPNPDHFRTLQYLQDNVVSNVGPLFFASIQGPPSGAFVNTPLTVVAAGMAKWLDIYSGVLMVRVLLSWFPNIPWDRQPLSAIRDLCDPYLNLFRNIIPPVFDTLDVSPLLAFAVLGVLGSILKNTTNAVV